MLPSLSTTVRYVVLLPTGSPGGTVAIRAIRIDQGGALARVFFRKQLSHGHIVSARVGVIAMHIGIGQLHRFDALVHFRR